MKNVDDKTIIDHIYQWAIETPDSIAIRCRKLALPYRELTTSADRLAERILAVNDSCRFIGLSVTKSADMVVGIVGIIQSGKAYLPLDREYPTERIAQMVEDAGIKHIVCDRSEQEFFAQFGLTTLTVSDVETKEVSLPNPTLPGPGELIALLYTSGSTGVPKGVCLTHAGVQNLVNHEIQARTVGPDTRNLLFSHLSFDVSLQEIFVSLVSGGTLHIIDDSIRLDAEMLLRYVDEHQLHRVFLPYVALQYFTETAMTLGLYPASLREVITGGELLKISPAIRNFFTQQRNCRLINIYGPTETSIWVTTIELPKDAETWPDIPTIGKPISQVDIFVLDPELNELPEGEIGELFVGGIAVSNGYLNREELTQERYLDWEDTKGTTHRLYRTGDLGCYLGNGEIEFHGRADNQVKIHGNRVELGEIEVRLSELPEVKQSVVAIREDQSGTKRLAAYLVGNGTTPLNQAQLRAHLAHTLPNYMIPAAFVWLDNFPLTASGKVDRKSLPAPTVSRPEIGTLYRKASNISEQRIAELWAELLDLDRIGADDNFFELGGNSLLAQQTIAQLRQRHGWVIPITKLYQFPSAAQLAATVDQAAKPKLSSKTANRKTVPQRHKDVAIIGMAGRFPGANTVDELWQALLKGKETIKFFKDEEMDSSLPTTTLRDPNYVKARGIIDDVDRFDTAVFGINPVLATIMDPQQRIFLEICRDVLEQTGYLGTKSELSVGVYASTGNNTYFINNVQHHPEEIAKIGEFQATLANEKDYTATRVAYQLDLKGPAIGVNTACSSSLVAVIQAVDAIRNGQCELAIAGGVSITVPVNCGQRFEEGAMFSVDGHTRTFDAEATGTVFSDGAAVVLLKDLESAQADGDTIYAVIQGVGVSNDGGGKGSFMAPSPEGQALAIRMAIDDANICPDDIGYIEAHGTATPLGDPIEFEGLKLAFGETEKKQYCRIGSIKSNLGHLTYAAGVTGLIKTALSLYHSTLPATINFDSPNPNIDFTASPFIVNDQLYALPHKKDFVAGVSSFGVGGTNAHVILHSPPVRQQSATAHTDTTESPILLTWSARTPGAGEGYAIKLAGYLQDNANVSLESVAYTLQQTRPNLNLRYAVAGENRTQLIEQLRSGKYVQRELRERTENLVFLFPGQGAQYPGMGSDLYQQEPVYRHAVDECAQILADETGEDIRPLIFPGHNLSAEEDAQILRNTRYTQPALFVTSYALAKLWMSWGIHPTVFIGHSIGEYVAATLSGIFSLADALKLIAERGRLSASVPTGSMLSVRAAAEEIQPLLHASLSMAANNAPQLCVVAGPDEQITALTNLLEEKGIACKPLHTSHAFHSEMMRPILDPFREVVAGVKLSIPKTPIISTVTGSWLSDKEALDPTYWTNHIISTVRFSDAIRFSERELETPTYLEAGPGQVTATLTKQHGGKLSDSTLSSIRPAGGDECLSIRQTLAQVWMRGIEPQWKKLYEHSPTTLHTLPTYAYDRKQFWIFPKSHIDQQATTNNQLFPTVMRKDNLIDQIRTILEDASGIDIAQASTSASFSELGLDSLLLTQIAQSLKKAFDVPITFRMLNDDCQNLDLLAAYLDTHLPPDRYAVADQPPPNVALQNVTSAAAGNLSIPQANGQSADAISLISQQINLISQQIALLQGTASVTTPQTAGPTPAIPLQANGNGSTKAAPHEEVELTPEEVASIKKPFGATARIEKQSTALDDTQSQFLVDLIGRYTSKTAKSKAYTQEHRSYMADPRVVSGFRPNTKELVYSIVVNRSKGARLWDIDGNEYIDALNGFGSNMLGYQPDFITEALHQQIDEGYEVGPQHEKAGPVCKLICELTGMERAALCNTGSEAVLGAMRIARTTTGRSTIVAFSNSYHGIVDEVIVRGTKKLKSFPAASGILPEAVQNMLILDYGTPESLEIIRERAADIAAVLVEPIQSRRPEFQPVEFVRELRDITASSGIVLVFDEVITGFRMHLHGIQHIWGVQADLATYGKVIGGGISIGAIAGKSAYMDVLDGGYWSYGNDTIPEVGVTYFAGTFVRHPLALAATKASLEYLKKQGPQLQEKLTERTRSLADELNKICQKYQTPIFIAQFGSLWKVKYHQEFAYSELLFVAMRLRGIHIQDGFPCFLTTAHTDEDIRQLIHAFEGSVHELVRAKFIPTTGQLDLDNFPPIPNAKRGKDNEGKPAWFIEDEQHPGKYLQIELHN